VVSGIKRIQVNMDNSQENIKTGLDPECIKDLDKTRKWAMFLAVFGFIVSGVLLIVGIFAVVFFSIFNKGDTSTIYPGWYICSVLIASAILYFFPVLYLYRFSKNMSGAVKTNDKTLVTTAFQNLRYSFTWFGILVIVAIAVYIITFLVLGSSVALLKEIG
jgi:cytochrome oxidase assembly protein ShyY1